MSIKNKFAVTFALTMLVVSLLVGNIFGQTRAEPSGEATLFGVHTLAAGQTLRLAVVNRKALFDGEIVPCVRVRVVFDIYEANPPDPVRLRFARRVERSLTLDTGDAASFDYPASRGGGERVNVSLFVSPDEANPPEPVRLAVSSTLGLHQGERMLFTLPGVIKGFNPQPDPPVDRSL